jgi:hypothetical protein
MQLLTNSDAATGDAYEITRPDQFFTFYAYGNFDGAQVRLEVSPYGGVWFDTAILLDAKGAQNVEFRAKSVRAIVEGGTELTSITAHLL